MAAEYDWSDWAQDRIAHGEHIVLSPAGREPALIHPGCGGPDPACEFAGLEFAEPEPAITGAVYVPTIDENNKIGPTTHVEWGEVTAAGLGIF